jgi:NADH-quinone oxidoreductase subunit M
MMLEALIALALLGSLAAFVVDDERAGKVAFGASLLPLAASLWMYGVAMGNPDVMSGNALLADSSLAFETNATWLSVGPFAVNWHVGLDGIGLPLVVLTTLLTSTAIMSAWTPIDERQSQFYGLVLFMEAALVGVFSALDFFAWFVFWEAVLLPMYFLIAIWGGPRRKYAAIKFFVYTNIASLVMFIGFAALVFGIDWGAVEASQSFDMPAVAQALRAGALGSLVGIGAGTLKVVAFFAMFLGFAVKVPVVPFHTWLPDAHVEAPTPVSVLLAGVLLKMGTYALLRFNFTMLPDVATEYVTVIAIFAVVSVIYGAMLAMAQRDLKRIVAYSSVSSMGYVILGLAAYTTYGIGGATFQMVSHGLISGLMFMTVGVIYNQTHTRMVSHMSGLADRMPIAVGVFVAAAFGYMGLPLMSGFAGEFFVFVGSFGTFAGSRLFTALAMFGIVLVAGYLLFAMQRVLFGEYHVEEDYELRRAPLQDVVPLVVLLAFIILLGVFPMIAFDMITDAVQVLAGGGV